MKEMKAETVGRWTRVGVIGVVLGLVTIAILFVYGPKGHYSEDDSMEALPMKERQERRAESSAHLRGSVANQAVESQTAEITTNNEFVVTIEEFSFVPRSKR
jgi:hypothetical protein